MTFLPIVERELRVACRRSTTYLLRFFLALGVLVLWFFLLVMGRSSVVERGQMLFMAIGVLSLGFCLFAGVFLTADCLSEERREGTLGLLFLTELKGFDVVLGKLIATSLHSFYGLLAVLPLLALPLLMGGVTAGEFWRITLVLTATLVLSLSIGMLLSAFSSETRQAMTSTLLALIFLSGILPVLWWLKNLLAKGTPWDFLLWPSPVYAYGKAFDSYFRSRASAQEFWHSLLTLYFISGFSLVVSSLHLPRAWREKGEGNGTREPSGWLRRLGLGSAAFRSEHRRWLEHNPFYWLASRDQRPRRMAAAILIPLFAVWLCFLGGCFSVSMNTKATCLSISMFMAFGLHQVFKCMVAIEASRRLSDDRHSGALELLVVTPIPLESILAGQKRALRELFGGPMALVLLTNAALLVMLILFNPLRMHGDDLLLFFEMLVGGAVMMLVDFAALGWIGMWMALRTRRHHRAILATIARVMLPPWLAIVLLIFFEMGGRGIGQGEIAVLSTVWFGVGILFELILMVRARAGVLQGLRERAARRTLAAPVTSTPVGASVEARNPKLQAP